MGEEIVIEQDNMNTGETKQIGKVNPLQAANPEFEGLGTMGYAKRVTIDGTQLLFKDSGKTVDSLKVVLECGRAVKQLFIEESNTFIKSYDGKSTTDGEPVSMYPGLRDCFELDFMCFDEEEGDEVPHQLVLSPTGSYAFQDYSKKLLKDCKKKVSEVETIITVVRALNKKQIRYSKPQFTCRELIELAAAPAITETK
jgi:hypothetical protein